MTKRIRVAIAVMTMMGISAYFCISWQFSQTSSVIEPQFNEMLLDLRPDVTNEMSAAETEMEIWNATAGPGFKRRNQALDEGNGVAKLIQFRPKPNQGRAVVKYDSIIEHSQQDESMIRDPSLIHIRSNIARSSHYNRKDSLTRNEIDETTYSSQHSAEDADFTGAVNEIDETMYPSQHTGRDANINQADKDHDIYVKPTPLPRFTTAYTRRVCKHSLKHFIMTKIEKTGSTTLFSVFARYIWRHKLSILSQTDRYHVDWTRHKQGRQWVIGPYRNDIAEAMICHARYNQTAYDRYIVKDYRYIVAVRHPVNWILSAVPFFADSENEPRVRERFAEETIRNDKLLFTSRYDATNVKSYFHLPQLQWLGLDYVRDGNNLTAIKEYIAGMIPKIDLPILNEQFDASLIVLRRRYCWDYTDIIYTQKNVQLYKEEKLTEAAVNKLLSEHVNLGELLLYEAVNDTWWRQEEVNQKDFWDEVQYFTELNSRISNICYNGTQWSKSGAVVGATQWHEQFTITGTLCAVLILDKDMMLDMVTKYAKGLFKPPKF